MDSILLRQIIISKPEVRTRKIKHIFKEIEEEYNYIKEIKYSLYYRIDEDRFWYQKTEDGVQKEEHHTKNGLYKSLEILTGIKNRYELFKDDDVTVTDIVSLSEDLEKKIISLSRKEDDNNQIRKKTQDGIFFKS